MLSEFAFEANIAMNLDDPDENQQRSLLKTTLFDFFRTDLDQTRYSPAQIHALLSKYAHDPDRLADRLIAVSQNKAEIETSPAFHEVHRLFVEEIKGIGTLNIEKLADDFERLRSCYKGMTGSEYPEQMHLMAQVLSNGKGSEEEFDRLLFFKDFFLEKMQPENLKAKAKLPEAASLNYPVFWQKHKETLSHLIKLARDPLKVFLRLAKDFQGHSSKTLEKLEKLTPRTPFLRKSEEQISSGDHR
jgi:hypothetical protein